MSRSQKVDGMHLGNLTGRSEMCSHLGVYFNTGFNEESTECHNVTFIMGPLHDLNKSFDRGLSGIVFLCNYPH